MLITILCSIIGVCLGIIVQQHSIIRRYERTVREYESLQEKRLEKLNNIFDSLQSKDTWK